MVTCWNQQFVANWFISLEMSWSPLSLTCVLGISCREKMVFMAAVMADDVVVDSGITSGHHEKCVVNHYNILPSLQFK